MNTRNADAIRHLLSLTQSREDDSKNLPPIQYGKSLDLLNALQSNLEFAICDFAVGLTHDIFERDTGQILRVFWFSVGMSDFYLCIDGTGLIRALEEEMPAHLFDQIMSALESFHG